MKRLYKYLQSNLETIVEKKRIQSLKKNLYKTKQKTLKTNY